MALTPQQWEQCDSQLCSGYGFVHLLVDGFKLSLQSYISKRRMRVEIAVWVNGHVIGSWLTTDCEERRRFMCPVKCYPMRGMHRSIRRKSGKRFADRCFPDAHKASTYYVSAWTSFRRLKAHLIENNQAIDLCERATAAGVTP